MARSDRAVVLVGGLGILGLLYLVTRPKTVANTQGTGTQGILNAGANLIGTIFRTVPATGGTPGQSNATPPQNDPSNGSDVPVDCTDPANANDIWCFDPNGPPAAIPDFSPGGGSDMGSYYDSPTDPTYVDPVSMYGDGAVAFV